METDFSAPLEDKTIGSQNATDIKVPDNPSVDNDVMNSKSSSESSTKTVTSETKPDKKMSFAQLARELRRRDEFGQTKLHHCSVEGDVEAVVEMLAQGADPALQDDDGLNALHLAARNRHADVAEALLSADDDDDKIEDNKRLLSAVTHEGKTALHLAAFYDYRGKVVSVLLKHGAQTELVDASNSTPLHWAARMGLVSVIHSLVEAKADIDFVSDSNGSSALLHAVKKGEADAVEALLELKANVGVQDTKGNTPLHHAAQIGIPEICRALVAAGANTSALSMSGKTPAAVARSAIIASILSEQAATEQMS